jgi:hypothetical protein
VKQSVPIITSLEKTCFRVAAHVVARVAGRDIQTELDRLYAQSRSRSYAETAGILAALFGLALAAASFGWVGLLLYFAVVAIMLH